MRVHYSTINQYKNCPRSFKFRYLDKLETLPNCDADNPLKIGAFLHRAIETNFETAIAEYYASYPIVTDAHVTEAMKLEYLVPIVNAMLPSGEHEVNFKTEDYEGTIDLLVPAENESDVYDIYDFKYSNNVVGYMGSPQLHLYRYFYEQANPGKKIRDLYYVFVPKTFLRLKYKNKTNPRDETLYEYRNRCMDDLKTKHVQICKVEYDETQVIEFLRDYAKCLKDEEYQTNPTKLCDWCEYKDYCQRGIDYMILPKNERREVTISAKKKIWLYAPPFAGKTTLTDKFPDPLILTTDGNIKNVTAPDVYLKDEVTVNGRLTSRKFAWEVFKETIDELEKKQNDFKTISLDLVEDTREMCRLYMYDKLGIQHESDSGFGKGWDIIKTEYLSTMRRFFNMDYDNIIICSHEDISKNLTKKSGEQITRISPNIQEAIATKLAGMVDIVARIIVKDDATRTISFKTDSVIFGGGRLNVTGREIPCTYEALMEVYNEANGPKKEESVEVQKQESVDEVEEPVKKEDDEPEQAIEEQPVRRRRRQ